ncbi:FAD dependent sulfhydryl oxidase Erv2 [Trichophyton tonsurans CBS 112818]|uniref:Sulfhydryl oxidase n=1 Tax=Trichophyton tonsurans (strain CBS 112818) TaxID=647933 RepID=F2S479_TRIT1|nr:FAD dependent sulfhydryl oxidase Erv2 [Trichophyton tonsurans CBS 112818]
MMLAHRPASRFFILTALAVFFILTISFFRVSPISPEKRAPGHLVQQQEPIPKDGNVPLSLLQGETIMPTLENSTANGDCATHFVKLLQKYPPQTSSRNAAAGWGCLVHNEVNRRLRKDLFDCTKIGDFYDCGCGDDKDKKKGGDQSKGGANDGVKTQEDSTKPRKPKKMLWGDANGPFPGGPVEITDEP